MAGAGIKQKTKSEKIPASIAMTFSQYSAAMKYNKTTPYINGRKVSGEGHLQPSGNPWIGVFIVPDNLFKGAPEQWVSLRVEYEGPFDCKHECIHGRGKAKITFTSRECEKGKVIINTEGERQPELQKEMRKTIRPGYSSNMAVKDTKVHKMRSK